ncbi:hypothetical protein [Synechococcus sp. MIT S9510]|uniref:hypothetical protein n=1 Tax=unclassified Synechococcus TaxID=2626047 RepID=UPI0039B04133
MTAFCEASRPHAEKAKRANGTDSNIGPKYLNARYVFCGSCSQQDNLNMLYLCRCLDQPEVVGTTGRM